ncbi:MAG TPA: glycosyltransferase family 9 protein [Gemmatimonadaceae bacterium]|jgi:heptosyltransferase-2|nr:glycosyltransferase family 9 protein [Gemmatimonadaceae bacterium]
MSAASLVVQTSFLGDTVLTTPLIAELARRGPVDVVVTPASAALLSNNPDIRKLHVYDKRHRDSGIAGLLRLGRAIVRGDGERGRASEVRIAYLAQGSMRSASLAILAGSRKRVGFETSPARFLYTHVVPYDRSAHHAERLWHLATAAGGSVSVEMPPPRLYPGASERASVDELLGPADDPRPLVALAPGSVWGTKRWPYYPELAARIARRCRIAIVGSSDDSDAAASIAGAARAQGVVDATGKLSLLASAELIGRADLLVTNDSSPQHLASAMATPTVTIFGPTVPAFGFGPLAADSTTLGHPSLPCRPCHHHGPPTCPLGHWKCMRELPVEVVEEAVGRILDSQARKEETGNREQ